MNKHKDIMNYWPFNYPPRKNQVTALTWLANQTAKYLILEAPIGSGKSNVGITYSAYLDAKSYVITPQRILQEQYEESFKDVPSVDVAVLYGKANYSCKSKRTNCDIGSMIKPSCNDCPHSKAKKKAQFSNNTVLNYKLALTSFAFTENFEKRKLLILDECHTMEEHLVAFDSIQILKWRCDKYQLPFKKQTSLSSAIEWMRDVYLPELIDTLDELQVKSDMLMDKAGNELTRADIKYLREVESFADHVDEVQELILRTNKYIETNFVIVWDDIHFELKRLHGDYTFRNVVFPKADKFLFMSSTILDKDGFCKDLGIDPSDAAFLSLESEFPVENRPVIYMPQMKMNYKWISSENASCRTNLLNAIHRLLDMHKDQSGIIHTGNFAIAKWLVDNIGNVNHHIFHHNPDSDDDRNAVIRAFTSYPKPSVLISPSSTEGLDLKDDLGRFAIFAKVPYPNLGDQWIKRRMELSSTWYMRQALINIIQGGGRIVRSETDEGQVYILDESFGALYRNSNNMIPKWWKDSYHTI